MIEMVVVFGISLVICLIGFFIGRKVSKKQKTVGSLIVNYDENCLDGPYVLIELDKELGQLERGSTISLVVKEQI